MSSDLLLDEAPKVEEKASAPEIGGVSSSRIALFVFRMLSHHSRAPLLLVTPVCLASRMTVTF